MGRLSSAFRSMGDFSLTSGNWTDILGGPKTSSGVHVSEQSSLQIGAVYACVSLLSKIMGSLPLFVYRRLSPGKARAPDHPLYSLLHDEPNPEMTAMIWRETMTGHLALWGNCYSEIEYDENWIPKALWPLRPDGTFPYRDQQTGQIMYSTFIPRLNISVALPAWRVLHVPLFGLDGYMGKSPIRLHMETLGMSVAMTRYGGSFFSNGAKPSGVLTHPKTLSEAAQTRLRNTFDVKYGGLENSCRTMILEEGLDFHQIAIKPEEAQFLESRNFSVNEIARIYSVPPHMIGELSRSTNNNIEHQGIEFQTMTMMPYCVRYEQEYTRKLLSSKEKKKFFVEHFMDGLSRGDMGSRYTSYSQAINGGWMSPDEARAAENLNPIENGQGKIYRVPVNTLPAEIALKFWTAKMTPAQNSAKGGEEDAKQTGNS